MLGALRERYASIEAKTAAFYRDKAARIKVPSQAFIDGGFRAVLTCVELAKLPAAWLGRPVDEALATDLARLPDVDPCGERGEYHTFVYGGPLFSVPILWRPGPIHEQDGFAQLELLPR